MQDVAFAPDGRWLATSAPTAVRIWPLDRPLPRRLPVPEGWLKGVAFSTDARYVVSAQDGQVRTWPLSREAGAQNRTVFQNKPDETFLSDEKYYRRERCFGTFMRSFSLKSTVSPDRIKATFKDGVLTIKVPGPEEEKPKQVTVTVE